MSGHDDKHGSNSDIRFEETDVATKPVATSVIVLAVFTVVFTIAAHFTFKHLAERQKESSAPASPLAAQYAAKQPPEPRLQLEPKTDLELLHAEEDKVLRKWGWVDKNAGVVQVPVDRGMKMLLAKGLPARQGGKVPASMQPKGVAPRQMHEAAGAPDWHWNTETTPGEYAVNEGHEKQASGAEAHGAHGH